MKNVNTDSVFRMQSGMFYKSRLTPENITAAREKALVSLYSGTKEERLYSLRYNFEQSLPQTSAAAKFHSLRVYYQVMEWKRTCVNMKPQDWRWQIVDRRCMPIQTDQLAAPPEILDVICCNCKKNCKTRNCICQNTWVLEFNVDSVLFIGLLLFMPDECELIRPQFFPAFKKAQV